MEIREMIWPPEMPLMTAGETMAFSCVFESASSVTSPSIKVYANKTDVTSTLCPTGSTTASGNVVTTKPIVIPTNPAARYVAEITATVDGNVEVRPFQIMTRPNGEER